MGQAKPWMNEPDREEFKHAGFDCLLNRNRLGAWCGYVAVKPAHPLHGLHYDHPDVEVHGGLTYAHECQGDICHVTEEEDNVWWFGFDCAHAGDFSPIDKWSDKEAAEKVKTLGLSAFSEQGDDIYRDINYVRKQTKSLAEQLSRFVGEKVTISEEQRARDNRTTAIIIEDAEKAMVKFEARCGTIEVTAT